MALSWAQLRNATYPSEFPRAKAAPLRDGVYEEEIVPGAATRLKIQLADIAGFGQIDDDGTQSMRRWCSLARRVAAAPLSIWLRSEREWFGNPAATVLLGDRVAVRAIQVEGHNYRCRMRVEGPQRPSSRAYQGSHSRLYAPGRATQLGK